MAAFAITTDEACECCEQQHAELLITAEQAEIFAQTPGHRHRHRVLHYHRLIVCQECAGLLAAHPMNDHLGIGACLQ